MLTACITKPLLTPPPVAANAAADETREAILRALLHNRWELLSDQPGEMTARFSRADWTMVVQIAYSNEVSIRYVSSQNLGYELSKEGTPMIHRGYNTRVLSLSRAIGTEVRIARAMTTLPPVAAPPPAGTSSQ